MLKIKILIFTLLGVILNLPSIKAQVMDSPPLDGVYEKIHNLNRVPIPYAPLREADALWTKRIWRVIDMREKINHPFYYPIDEQNGRKSFMQVVLSAIQEGSITAYDIGNDEFLIPFTYEQIMKNLNSTDSVTQQRDYPPYDYYDTVIVQKFEPSTVKKIRIKEDWFFDKQRSVMDVRILGICPILDDIDPVTGESRGSKPLFWIYFPDARKIFANAEVFNRFNDAARLTYDDLFFKRMFNSYIYKETNVYDRKIIEYATGMDALLESERIKNDIFLWEHDLWEY
ncbi:MAG TPA: gliding motility protein GldN [Bacteroidales bacterium]|nr:gliding motility protein GldN [Bacteroidales bacterium]HPS16010.1 gliding motility protein GldN [Bacteroidales bacterium]